MGEGIGPFGSAWLQYRAKYGAQDFSMCEGRGDVAPDAEFETPGIDNSATETAIDRVATDAQQDGTENHIESPDSCRCSVPHRDECITRDEGPHDEKQSADDRILGLPRLLTFCQGDPRSSWVISVRVMQTLNGSSP